VPLTPNTNSHSLCFPVSPVALHFWTSRNALSSAMGSWSFRLITWVLRKQFWEVMRVKWLPGVWSRHKGVVLWHRILVVFVFWLQTPLLNLNLRQGVYLHTTENGSSSGSVCVCVCVCVCG
jgi:hypothetical protein